LLKTALAKGADVYVSADFKYHEFFDAEDKIMIADIGHFESEKFTIDLLKDLLLKICEPERILCTQVNTNPIKYFF
jgi:putative NIF3 family GTP cyclohydrolase 1 type 2